MRALFHCAALALDKEMLMVTERLLLIFGLAPPIQPLVLRMWFEVDRVYNEP